MPNPSSFDSENDSSQLSEQEQIQEMEELHQLTLLVVKALTEGDDRKEVIADLANNGWDEDEANEFVESIEQQLTQNRLEQASQNNGSGVMGWAVWIAVIIGINILSSIFNWGFTIF